MFQRQHMKISTKITSLPKHAKYFQHGRVTYFRLTSSIRPNPLVRSMSDSSPLDIPPRSLLDSFLSSKAPKTSSALKRLLLEQVAIA